MSFYEYFLKFLEISWWPIAIGFAIVPIGKGLGEMFSAIGRYIDFLIQEKM